MRIGDWGLEMGIGDWGLGPIPNPQSPIPIFHIEFIIILKIISKNCLYLYKININDIYN